MLPGVRTCAPLEGGVPDSCIGGPPVGLGVKGAGSIKMREARTLPKRRGEGHRVQAKGMKEQQVAIPPAGMHWKGGRYRPAYDRPLSP